MPRILHLILILLIPASLFSQPQPQDIQRLMDKARIPGLSLAYIKNGKIAQLYTLGVRSADTRIPVDSTTVFSAASLSKCVFAYGVMQLADAGKLDLDKPLYNYYDYTDLKHDERYKQITARQVLSHTSGLPNWRQSDTLNFQYNPGERFRYSGEGFVLLGKVVEKITGQPLEDFMQQTVFKPLGMAHSSYIWQKTFESDCAVPHSDIMQTNTSWRPREPNTASSLQTTAADYAKFEMALLNKRGLKAATFQQMFTPQPKSQMVQDNKALYWGLGLGYELSDYGPAFWQWGDNGTFKAFLIGYPGKKEGLVYFANSYNGLAIADDLLQLFFNSKQPALEWLAKSYESLPFLALLNRLNTQPFAEAMQPFLQAGTNHQDTTLLPEQQMNDLGNRLLGRKKNEAAAQVFTLNLNAYPQSANAYKGLATAQLRSGQKEAAAASFRKYYALDPKAAASRMEGNDSMVVTTFRLERYSNATSVAVGGSFNGWNDMDYPMQWNNGAWTIQLPLKPGKYEYKFSVDGVWIPDPGNKKIEPNHQNSILEVAK